MKQIKNTKVLDSNKSWWTINSRAIDGHKLAIGFTDADHINMRYINDSAVPFNAITVTYAANAVSRVIEWKSRKETLVVFANGDTVRVRCMEGDKYDIREAIKNAIFKHTFGTSYGRQIDKIVDTCLVDGDNPPTKQPTTVEMEPING